MLPGNASNEKTVNGPRRRGIENLTFENRSSQRIRSQSSAGQRAGEVARAVCRSGNSDIEIVGDEKLAELFKVEKEK